MHINPTSISAVFESQAAQRPYVVAIRDGSRSFSYSELDRRCKQLAIALKGMSVEEGDRVVFLARNCVEFFILLGATQRIGAILCPINFRLTGDEVAYIVDNAAPKVCFAAAEHADKLENPLRGPQGLQCHVFVPGDGQLVASEKFGDMPVPRPAIVDEESDILLLYTSGTTGRPKGVRINGRNYAAMLAGFPKVPGFRFEPQSIVGSTMPLFHIAGINVGMAAMAQSCSLILYPSFNAQQLLTDLARYGINYVFLAPSMIVDMINHEQSQSLDFSSLKCIAYGASSIPLPVLSRARHLMSCDFAQLYGMTESTGAGTYLSPAAHDLPDKLGSCGMAWPEMEFCIINENGEPQPSRQMGQLCMRGPYVTPGYFENDEASSLSLVDGWLRTGDAAYIDEDGYVFIKDRIKDLIISGGENVSPIEVENSIGGCPGVIEVAVIGVPSEKWGEEIKAVVVPGKGASVSEQDVIQWSRQRIAGFKVPKSVDFVDAFPKNAAGKVLKRELRNRYWLSEDRKI